VGLVAVKPDGLGPGEIHARGQSDRDRGQQKARPRERVLLNGWGTSGACPQVAGLAALMISAEPELSRKDVFNRIRNSTTSLGFGHECQGTGLIDCEAALAVA
jgi:subtilisin family serine protease